MSGDATFRVWRGNADGGAFAGTHTQTRSGVVSAIQKPQVIVTEPQPAREFVPGA